MTNRVNEFETERRGGMRKRARSAFVSALVAATCVVMGCEKAAPPPAPAPAPSKPVAQQSSLDQVKMDSRVQFPAERLPGDQSLTTAIAALASALAAGDDKALGGMLDRPGQSVLRSLVERGEWKTATSGVEVVRVVAIEGGQGSAKVGLGVQDSGGAYLLGWEGHATDGLWTFSGLGVKDQKAARASDLDGVELSEEALAVAKPTPPPPKATEEDDAPVRPKAKGQQKSGGGRLNPGG